MSDQFNPLENSTIGRNISMYRKIRNLKASDVAEQIGLKEATYTKYERGETQITIDLLNRVGEVLKIDPLTLLTTPPGTYFDNVSNNTNSVIVGSNNNIADAKQTELIIELIKTVTATSERVTTMCERVITLLEQKG